MKLFAILKPEFLYNPRQILRRLRLSEQCIRSGVCDVDLRWGLRLRVNPGELIGNCVARLGVYDLSVSEALWRLADPGETAVDAGSNIGYTASILACRVGETGRVYCFEPHPDIYERLARNVAGWGLPVETFNLALSDGDGEAVLHVPTYFTGNQGTATLADPREGRAYRDVTVQTRTLDGVREVTGPISLMKVDVEGHELQLFSGAKARLGAGEIRDILFEDHGRPPTEVMRMLQAHGYAIFALHRRFSGPKLLPISEGLPRRTPEEPPNYIATRDQERLTSRMGVRGWRVLTSGRQGKRPTTAR